MRIKKQILLLLLICKLIHAQDNPVLDSLLQVLKTKKEDTSKVNLLISITELCYEDQIKDYALPAIRLSKKLNYISGEAKAYGNLGFYYTNSGNKDSAEYCFRRSISVFLNENNYVGAGEGYNNLGYLLQRINFSQNSNICFDSSVYFFTL